MKVEFYKIQCVTDMHIGSSDVNYNIVDNQVERDAVTGFPIIHASGFKGALRDALEGVDETTMQTIFGTGSGKADMKSGSCKFLDAIMLARPMRVAESKSMASIPVATRASINNFIELLDTFGCNKFGINPLPEIDFGDNCFLTNSPESILIEGDATGKLPEEVNQELKKIKSIINGHIALATNFDDYELPVMSRTRISSTGSQNLWFEEVVPHGSIFCFGVISNGTSLAIPPLMQIGGNASIGRGIVRITKL